MQGELFNTEKELIDNLTQNDGQWYDLTANRGNYFKINIGFVGYCIFENVKLLDNLEDIIRKYSNETLPPHELNNLHEVLRFDKAQRLIQNKQIEKLKPSDLKKEIYFQNDFDLFKWKNNGYDGSLDKYRLNQPANTVYYIEKYDYLIKKVIEFFDLFSGYNFYEKILLYGPESSFKRRYSFI